MKLQAANIAEAREKAAAMAALPPEQRTYALTVGEEKAGETLPTGEQEAGWLDQEG